MCCGVGISTRALKEAFPESEMVVGVDTSPEMIKMANFLTTHLGFFKPVLAYLTGVIQKGSPGNQRQGVCRPVFAKGNAEQTEFPCQSFDLVTIMYAFHEAPKEGRARILQEAYRVLKPGGTVAVVDICTDYKPSDSMLAGEPYGE
jgi:ubiquinone/menaquinone biosynthesis C-methylase UbiE